ncbi:MAG: sigma-70 family RNA polymerase sigma factor [Clostridiales bacterium]|jgi:RNA polymerase sigma-70 factor (ECF subfamily)|nr:sigma-70 family RNA polymerase sigma factor [Clostridiales bacterium]
MTTEFERIYDEYSPLLYRLGLLYLGNGAAAEDLTQDCFVKLYERGAEFGGEGHLKGWLITVARNLCRNAVKKNARTVPLTYDLPAKPQKTDYALAEIFKLNASERAAVYLFYYEGYTSKEIAGLTKSTDAAVRSRLKRARGELRELLTDEVT